MADLPASNDPIAAALAEDIGSGDATVEFFIDPETNRQVAARIFARETDDHRGRCRRSRRKSSRGSIPRSSVAARKRSDGSPVIQPGDTILTDDRGRAGSILTAERVALNFLQRLSGVATLTRRFVDAVAGTHGAHSRHPQDHPRPARARKSRRPRRGRAQSPHGSLRHGDGQGQPPPRRIHVSTRSRPPFTRARVARPGLRIELEADTLAQVYIVFSSAWTAWT